MSTWPPPPDLHSIQELVRAADPEGHLAEGAAADEYEPEEEAIFASISTWPTEKLTAENLLPVIEQIWRDSFAYSGEVLTTRRSALLGLAEQIARFFGPEAKPLTRGNL